MALFESRAIGLRAQLGIGLHVPCACTETRGKLCASLMSATADSGRFLSSIRSSASIQIEGLHFILNCDDSAPFVESSKELQKSSWPRRTCGGSLACVPSQGLSPGAALVTFLVLAALGK